MLVPVSKSRKISCHLPSNIAPTSSSLQHSWIQDKSPSHPTSSPAQVTESPPCPSPPSPHWPCPQRLSPRSIPLSDGRGKGSWAKCLFVEELNHKIGKKYLSFGAWGFSSWNSSKRAVPGQESHSPVPTAASWEYEAWRGPRNRTFCWARLRPSLLPKLQEPSPLASRSILPLGGKR